MTHIALKRRHWKNRSAIVGNIAPTAMDLAAIRQKADDLAALPYPSLALGSALMWQGVNAIPAVAVDNNGQTSGSLFKFGAKVAKAGPTRLLCFAFGAANLLGSWMMYDGDETNAAGFNFAWSTLYVIVNGRSSIKSVLRGRISPVALALLATGNAGLYGKKFLWK